MNRYAGGLHAFVHARVGSMLAADTTAEIFSAALRSLDATSFIEGSLARTLHEQAIAALILDSQEIHDERLDRFADVLAAETATAEAPPDPVMSTTVAAVLEAAKGVPTHLLEGPMAVSAAPRREPPPLDAVTKPPPEVPPLPVPEVPASKGRGGLLIVLVLLVAAIAAVAIGLVFYGDQLDDLGLFSALTITII